MEKINVRTFPIKPQQIRDSRKLPEKNQRSRKMKIIKIMAIFFRG